MSVKICHITTVHSPDDTRIFWKECISLAKAGFDVYLVQRGESGFEKGVNIVGIGDVPSRRIKRMIWGANRAYCAALSIDADLYHFHDPELMRIGLKLKKKGKKVIFDSHECTYKDIFDKPYLPRTLKPLISNLYKMYEKSICSRLDSVIYVSPNLKSYFDMLNPLSEMITNYPILDENPIEADYLGKNVVFVGLVTDGWLHHSVMKAIAGISGMKYSLYGPANAKYLEKLKSMPEWNIVKYYGKIPHSEISGKLSEGSVGVVLLRPSQNTTGKVGTLGNNKIFEDMMAGLPIVCTDFELWKDIVDRYHCGIYVDCNSDEEIKNALLYLSEHPKEARTMGLNGRRAVELEYNWNTQEKKLVALYNRVLNQTQTETN